jgi:hypothetical protein
MRDPPSLASRRSGGLPASPSAPPLRCPGAVTPRAVPLAARSQPRPLTRPGGRSVASRRARVRCLGPKTGWRPAGPPLATGRSRRVTFHPYKGETSASSVVGRGEEKSGSLVEAVISPPTGGVAGAEVESAILATGRIRTGRRRIHRSAVRGLVRSWRFPHAVW